MALDFSISMNCGDACASRFLLFAGMNVAEGGIEDVRSVSFSNTAAARGEEKKISVVADEEGDSVFFTIVNCEVIEAGIVFVIGVCRSICRYVWRMLTGTFARFRGVFSTGRGIHIFEQMFLI